MRFTSPTYSVVENAGPAVVCVIKDSEIDQPFSVDVISLELIPADATGEQSRAFEWPITLDHLTE